MAPKSKPASVNELPVAGFSYDANNLTVTFDASASYDPDGSIANFSWTFGDDAVGNGKVVTHTYAANGTYNATLTVADNGNAKNSTSKDVTVKKTIVPPPATKKPIAMITVDLKVNLTVTLNGSDSEAFGDRTIVSYAWTFGDSTSGSGAVVTHTYAANGTYNVTLTVTDSSGATNSTSIKVTVTKGETPPPQPHPQGPPGLLHAIEIHKLKADRNAGLQNSLDHLIGNLDRWLSGHGLTP